MTTILSNLNGSLDKWEQFHRRGPSEKIFSDAANGPKWWNRDLVVVRYDVIPFGLDPVVGGAEEKKSAKDRFGIKNFLRSDLLTG